MPKRVFRLPAFDKGIVSNPPARDVAEGAFTYANNVDSRVPGQIRGIQGETTVDVNFDARVMTALLGNTNYFIGQDKDGNWLRYNIDTDSTITVTSGSDFVKTLVVQNQQAYAAMTTSFRGDTPAAPQWFGYVESTPFGGSAGFILDDAEAKSYADQSKAGGSPHISLAWNNGGGTNGVAEFDDNSGSVFEQDVRYFWAISILYDGFQESPLIFGAADNQDRFFEVPSSDYAYADLVLTIEGALPDRITGFKVYRGKSTTGAEVPNTLYRLVAFNDTLVLDDSPDYKTYDTLANDISGGSDQSFVVNDASRYYEGDFIKIGTETFTITDINLAANTLDINPETFQNNHSAGDDVLVSFNTWHAQTNGGFLQVDKFYRIRDNGSSGATYEDNTGIAETLETTGLNYEINAEYSGYMFVGGVAKDDIPNSENYIFRSQPKAYSIFDWTNDFAILPERPVAMAGFNGRLYVFGPANMYRINPLSLEIEDTYRGVGALNENCVITTNFGMFHADDSNIYINDGRTSQPIGTPILEMDGGGAGQSGWTQAEKTNLTNEHYASLGFDPINKRVLLFVSVDSSNTACWAWDVQYQVWTFYDAYPVPSTTAVGPNGDLYAVIGDTSSGFELQTLFTNNTRKLWTIRTKDFVIGSDSGDFYAYDLHGYGTGNFTIKYLKDGASSATDPGTSTVDGLRKATVQSADKKMKSIALEVEAAAATDELDNLTVQVRPQVIQE